MSEGSWISITWVLMALVLAGSALASYRLSWSKGLRYALIWAAIFAFTAFFFDAVR